MDNHLSRAAYPPPDNLPPVVINDPSLPLVSIVTPSYNQGHYVRQTIESVLSQDYPNIEYWLIDGGSTDETLDIVREYMHDPRFHWLSEPDRGQSDAVNKGWSRCRGAILGWLNSDDLYLPGAIRTLARTFVEHPEARFFYGNGHIIDEHGNLRMVKRQPGYSLRKILNGNSLLQPAFFIHRDALQEVGFLDYRLHYVLDWSFTVRVFSRYRPEQRAYIPTPLAATREYNETKTRTGGRRMTVERRCFLINYFARQDLPETIYPFKHKAFMATFWRESFLEWHTGQYFGALRAAFIATANDPLSPILRLPLRFYRMAVRRLHGLV